MQEICLDRASLKTVIVFMLLLSGEKPASGKEERMLWLDEASLQNFPPAQNKSCQLYELG